MGYPCALGITTPMLAAIAGGKGISIGLLVKASEVFHELATTDTIVFDKTGTLTYGRPTVTDVVTFDAGRTDLLACAGSVEGHSEHPLGQSISFFAQREGIPKKPVEGFKAWPGKGVSAIIGGNEVLAGKPLFIEEHGVPLPNEVRSNIDSLSSEGKTVVIVAHGGKTIGVFALQDTPRRGAARLIEKLKQRRVKTVMLTGDSRRAAEAIGKSLGIDEVRAELSPADKASAIKTLQAEGRKIAMVGDGINDAPALAQANVGIAIGAGTDVAIESAGVILVSDRIQDVFSALILGKASYRTLTGNVIVAVIFNIFGMILAAMGMVSPILAISVMVLSIFAILLNTLRIRVINLEREEEPEIAPLVEVEFLIPNLVCEGCAEKINTILRSLPGIQEVRTKVPQKHAYVRYDPARIQRERIKKALEKSGFIALEA